ncbi:uncharacterized protein LOC109541683 isoform X1 [Dendroctonus ponderosae]|nr:uncharacterized protein LOC109541683 isoform X1 [Dendroctonus ponderosae]
MFSSKAIQNRRFSYVLCVCVRANITYSICGFYELLIMEWSNDKSFQLIDEYKKWPIVWDVKHPSHYSKKQKTIAWYAISDKLGVSVAEAKQKMNSLLGSLRREKSKILRAAGPGQAPIYNSRWFAFKRMQFLLYKEETEETTLDSEMEQHHFRNSEIIEVEIQDNPEEESGEKLIVAKRRTFRPSVAAPKPINDTTLDEKSFNSSLSARLEDPCATYGAHVANKLRSYTQQVRVQVEHAINNILFEADIGKFNTNPAGRSKMSPTMSDIFDPHDYE